MSAIEECGPLSCCARQGHVDAIDHGPGAVTVVPVCCYCQDTGWTAAIDADGNVEPVTCPDGCPTTGTAA